MIVLERYPLHPRFDPLELINSQQLSEFQTAADVHIFMSITFVVQKRALAFLKQTELAAQRRV